MCAVRLPIAIALAACSGPARQPAPQPQPSPPGHYVEFGVVEDRPAGAPGAVEREDQPMPPPPVYRSGPLEPSNRLKAYRGPESAIVVMVEVNDSKQMLVHFRNIDRELDGKTVLYNVEDLGYGNKNVYVNKQRGSKTIRSTMLIARGNHWQFFHPLKHDVQFDLGYSEWQSEQFAVDEIVASYNAQQGAL